MWLVQWTLPFPRVTSMPADFFAQQEAFEKCWAHSPLRAAARRAACSNFTLPFTRRRYCRHHYQDEPKPAIAIAQASVR